VKAKATQEAEAAVKAKATEEAEAAVKAKAKLEAEAVKQAGTDQVNPPLPHEGATNVRWCALYAFCGPRMREQQTCVCVRCMPSVVPA
jgi:hypothetical protein